ncbi:MAG TPA: HEAT repeat domain-containing protein [Thermoanaerobaculia bacterium]|nr:HEAT repeat domain-containing protein [Thermoanaerobaculia bacterium]
MKKLAFLLVLAAWPLRADLLSEVRSASGWIGYSVPVVEGRHTLCSWDSVMITGQKWNTPASVLLVMLHVSDGSVETIRLSSPECRAEHEVRWLREVDPRESLRLLRDLADAETGVAKKAVTAIALHRDAEGELISLARRHPSSKIRGTALFWVGQRAGARAAETLRDAIDHDPEREVKAKAVFGIAQLPDAQSVPILIDLLKTHRSREVRKKAAFWLSQKNDPRALQAFEEILTK